MRIALLIHLAALCLASMSFANIKNITPKNDEIIEIKTALGIATIIQLPEVIQSAIMGDQSAYRIEYVGQSVTIKPLRGGAKTNLYLFTKEKRYNLRLVVVPQNLASYIVYIKKPELGGTGTSWSAFGKTVVVGDLTLKVSKLGVTSDGFLLIYAQLTAKKSYHLEASDLWLWQGKESKIMDNLFLSRTDLKADQSTLIGIAIKRSELKPLPLTLEIKSSSKSLKMEIPKEALWR